MFKKLHWQNFRSKCHFCFNAASVLLIAGSLVVLADYVRFVDRINKAETPSITSSNNLEAEAVVVLTGGANRISTGVKLLKENHGHRLLISGVSATTTRSDLGRVLNDSSTMYGCCIDLDRKAQDTRGNAEQTAAWVKLHNFQKIILVTSSYHMPRSLMLVKEKMPSVEVIAISVQPPNWERNGFLERAISVIVMREYAKYRIAKLGFETSVRRIRSAFVPFSENARS